MGRLKQRHMAAQDAKRRPIRLGDLARQKVDVYCWCNRCGHNAVVDTPRLLAELGPDQAVPDIGMRMRCTGCGSKDVAARPAWPSSFRLSPKPSPEVDPGPEARLRESPEARLRESPEARLRDESDGSPNAANDEDDNGQKHAVESAEI